MDILVNTFLFLFILFLIHCLAFLRKTNKNHPCGHVHASFEEERHSKGCNLVNLMQASNFTAQSNDQEVVQR